MLHSTPATARAVRACHGSGSELFSDQPLGAMGREAKKGRAWYFRWRNRVWQRIYRMPLYRWAILTADHAVVINWETWTMLQLKYNREIGRVWYVPNGVEHHYFIQREYADGDAQRLLVPT